jgi:hypothetical protein
VRYLKKKNLKLGGREGGKSSLDLLTALCVVSIHSHWGQGAGPRLGGSLMFWFTPRPRHAPLDFEEELQYKWILTPSPPPPLKFDPTAMYGCILLELDLTPISIFVWCPQGKSCGPRQTTWWCTVAVGLQHDRFYCRAAANLSSLGTQLIPMYYMQRPFCGASLCAVPGPLTKTVLCTTFPGQACRSM